MKNPLTHPPLSLLAATLLFAGIAVSATHVGAHFMQQATSYKKVHAPQSVRPSAPEEPASSIGDLLRDQPAPVEVPANTLNRMGVYMTASSTARENFVDEILGNLQVTPRAAVIIDVKGSYVYFDGDTPLADELGLVRPLYDLPAIVRRVHASGGLVFARFIVVKDASLASRKPETQIRHPQTGVSVGSTWVDLAHPLAMEYNLNIAAAVIAAGVDEINFDYIRYPTEYAPWQIGLSGEERAARIEPFLLAVRSLIAQINPRTKLGISTYAILGWNFPINFAYVGQDIPGWGNIVDVVSPMAYPATFAEGHYYIPGKHPRSRMYYLVYRTLEGYKELLGENAWKIRPWIQGYGVTTQNMRDQMDAVLDAGACGFTVWSANNLYAPTFAAMKQLEIPERCESDSMKPETADAVPASDASPDGN